MKLRHLVLVGCLSVTSTTAARAETRQEGPTSELVTPLATRVPVPPGMADVAEPYSHTSNLLYLNGCFNAGDCNLTPGFESSRFNRSSIIDGNTTIRAFDAGTVAWDAVVECVRQTYAPFGIQITDQEPGEQDHFEAIVAGSPSDMGLGGNIGGVAPFDTSCRIINNAITFSFANIYDGFVPQICWTVAQESAHAFGLDHEFLCADPMTYLGECGARKTFQDVDASCGEFSPRACMCGGATQNSFQKLREHFGPGLASSNPCSTADDCNSGQTCVDDHCVVGPGSPGGLGEPCGGNGDCASGLCGSSSDGNLCAERCEAGGSGCPDGFSCIDSGAFSVCWPDDSGGCGCRLGAGNGSALGGVLVLFAIAATRIRRRRR